MRQFGQLIYSFIWSLLSFGKLLFAQRLGIKLSVVFLEITLIFQNAIVGSFLLELLVFGLDQIIQMFRICEWPET